MLKEINYQQLILPRSSYQRLADPDQIKPYSFRPDVEITQDLKEAFALAKSMYNKDSLILISGSFFFVSEAYEKLSFKRL